MVDSEKDQGTYRLRGYAAETQRLTAQSKLVRAIVGSHPFHPSMRHHLDPRLTPESETPFKVLEIATGAGDWVHDLIAHYPQASNLSIVATDLHLDLLDPDRPFPSNVKLLKWDLTAAVPEKLKNLGPFDVVHTRFITGALKREDWDRVTAQFISLVAPGGFLQHIEGDVKLGGVPGSYKFDGLPGSLNRLQDPGERFVTLMSAEQQARGLSPLAASDQLKRLKASGEFSEIIATPFGLPGGRQIFITEALKTFANNITPDQLEPYRELPQSPLRPLDASTNEQELGEIAVFNQKYILEAMLENSPEHFQGMDTQEKREFKKDYLIWLDKHTYYAPALWIVAKKL